MLSRALICICSLLFRHLRGTVACGDEMSVQPAANAARRAPVPPARAATVGQDRIRGGIAKQLRLVAATAVPAGSPRTGHRAPEWLAASARFGRRTSAS